MNQEQAFSIIRSIVKVVGSGMVANGYMSNGTWTELMGGIFVAGSMLASHMVHESLPPAAKKAGEGADL
jgi:hypothetical protein